MRECASARVIKLKKIARHKRVASVGVRELIHASPIGLRRTSEARKRGTVRKCESARVRKL